MKNKLSIVLSLVVCVALVAASVCIGAYRGWSDEREAVLHALSVDGGMYALLETRAMDAANLAVVAARHLPADDEALRTLRDTSSLMLSGAADAEALMLADDVITETAQRFASELSALPSVQESKRDRAYVSMLTTTLSQKTGLFNSYTTLVEDFNQRLSGSLTGKLAMLLGVTPLPGIGMK